MKMKLSISVAMVVIATLFLNLTSQNNSSDIENALLWRISGNGLEGNSYLYGTMHVGDSRIIQYGDSVPMALNSVDAVYGEIDLTDISAQMMVMKDMMMQGTTLSSLVSEEELELIKKELKGTPGELTMNMFKPFFTMGNMYLDFFPADELTVLDLHLLEKGKELGKEIGGIETLGEQIKAIDQLTLKEQAEMLVEFCKNKEEQVAMFKEMYECYLKEDLSELTKMAMDELEETSHTEFENALLIDRNKVMTERLDSIMQHKTLFFGVGSLHLLSEDGLIHLLKEKGYTVEPIKGNRPSLPVPVPPVPETKSKN